MSEPVLLGEIMKRYLLESNDDFAVAFRKLHREHNGDYLNQSNEENEENKQQ